MNNKTINRVDTGWLGDKSCWQAITETGMLAILLTSLLSLYIGNGWLELSAQVLVGVVSVTLGIRLLFDNKTRFVWSWTYLPVVLLLVLVVIQMLQLPVWLVEAVSPNTADIKSRLLGDIEISQVAIRHMSITFYPFKTEQGLGGIIVFLSTLIVVANVYRRPEQIKRILAAIAIIGSIAGGYGFLTGWTPKETMPNNILYSQLLIVSVGACLSLILVKLQENTLLNQNNWKQKVNFITLRPRRSVWFFTALLILCLVAIFVSRSAAGILCLIISGAFTIIALITKKKFAHRRLSIFSLSMGILVCIISGALDAIYWRWDTFTNSHVWSDLLGAVTKFPLFGGGLGASEALGSIADNANDPINSVIAKSELFKFAGETGIVGIILILTFLGLLLYKLISAIRKGRFPINWACFGLCFVLLSFMLQSLTDFGKTALVNIVLMGIICGLAVNVSSLDLPGVYRSGPSRKVLSRVWSKVSIILVTCSVVGVWVLFSLSAYRTNAAKKSWGSLSLLAEAQQEQPASQDNLSELAAYSALAAEMCPKNIEYQYSKYMYRWQVLSGENAVDISNAKVPKKSLPEVQQIVSDLYQLSQWCPTYGPIYSLAGQLELYVLNNPRGAERIKLAYELASDNPDVVFAAGVLDVKEGHYETSLTKMRRCLKLDQSFMPQVVDIYVNRGKRPDLALEVVKDNCRWIVHVIEVLNKTSGDSKSSSGTAAQARTLLEDYCQQEDTPAWVIASLAKVHDRLGNDATAIKYYRRALGIKYNQVHWRLRLAQALGRVKQISLALHEAKICLRIDPELKAAKKFISDTCVQSDRIDELRRLVPCKY